MKKTEGLVEKSGTLTAGELEKINRYTRRKFEESELYTFSVVLCDNEIDRDLERFTIKALHRLGELFLGKTGIFNHNPQTQNQAARIYDCHVEEVPDKKTRASEPYNRLVARAYLPHSEKNADFILELESGIKKEVSVGCSMAKAVCSVCGANRKATNCPHEKGKEYRGVLCCTVLDEPADAYEWSFVAVPAQREAGVIKQYTGKGERKTEEIWKSLYLDGEITLSDQERRAILKETELLREQAEDGRKYRADLQKSVVRLCGIAQPELPIKVMERAAEMMELEDLKEFEKAFRKKAGENFPLTPQLAMGVKKETTKNNQEFKI